MRTVRRLMAACLALVCAALIGSQALRADHDPCPHPVGWKPVDITKILEAHRAWMIQLGYIKLRDDDPFPEIPPDPAVLCRADLRGVDLSGAYLVEVDFSEADLTGANLENANMIAASLRNATLVEARLRGANLFMADLRNADLTRADLTDAHLVQTNLEGTIVTDADFTGALRVYH